MTLSSVHVRLALIAGASAVVSACGHSGSTPSQVVVRVNKDEISVHQLNQQLARVNATGMTDDQKVSAQKTVLDSLVDQDLLLEQAKAKQLDRDPEIVSAMESARRQVLVEAYVQKQIVPSAKPTEEEVKKYYNDNPALFAERRVYGLQEAIAAGLTNEQLAALRRQLSDTRGDPKSFEESLRWMKNHDIKVSANMGVRPAEQLPMRLLNGLAKVKDGGTALLDGPNNSVNVVKILSSQLAPVDEKSAKASIEQFLTNRKREELVRAEVKRLRDAAKIEYMGDFQKLAMQTNGAGSTGKPAPSTSSGESQASETGAKPADPLAKGLKGL